MTGKPTLDFWFEFASTYSYPAAMRIGAAGASARRGRALAAVPARADLQGARLDTSPFNLYAAEGPLHVARPGAHLRRA